MRRTIGYLPKCPRQVPLPLFIAGLLFFRFSVVGSPAATANTAIISFLLIPSAFSPENSILLSRDTPRSLPPRIQDAANPKGKGSGLALCACTYLHVHTQAPTHAHYTIYMHLGTHVHTRTNTRIQNGPERVRAISALTHFWLALSSIAFHFSDWRSNARNWPARRPRCRGITLW